MGNYAREIMTARKGPASSIPTLEDGELGWCTDTHELFMGSSAGNILIGIADIEDMTIDGGVWT